MTWFDFIGFRIRKSSVYNKEVSFTVRRESGIFMLFGLPLFSFFSLSLFHIFYLFIYLFFLFLFYFVFLWFSTYHLPFPNSQNPRHTPNKEVLLFFLINPKKNFGELKIPLSPNKTQKRDASIHGVTHFCSTNVKYLAR